MSSLIEDSNTQYRKCEVVTQDLKNKLVNQDYTLPMKHDLKELRKSQEKCYKAKAEELRTMESEVAQKQRMVELSSKCTNSWLHAMPISAQRRYMSKNEFQDALSLRYGMQIKGVALKCACGDTNSTIHANNCKLGGHITRRHDAMRNFLQQKAAIVYNDTEIEPHLQETETHALQQRVNPQDKSRSDIRINGFNREFQNSFLDVKVINIQAKSHEKHSVAKALEQAEDEKDQKYKTRIEDVENGTFYPVVFTTKGKRSRKCSMVIRKLVSKIAIKRKQPTYLISQAISTDISFLLLRSEIACVRGNRRPRSNPNNFVL